VKDLLAPFLAKGDTRGLCQIASTRSASLAMTLLRPPGYGGQAIFFGALHSVVRVAKEESRAQDKFGSWWDRQNVKG